MSEDTKKILHQFYGLLRENVNVLEVYRSMTGLSEFDIEQIHCERINHGNTLAMDKLINTIGRKSTLAFISFVQSLQKCGQDDIANKIIDETQQNFPNIHRLLTCMKPTAAIFPSMKPNPEENILNDLTTRCDEHATPNIVHSDNGKETNKILETNLDSLENENFLYLVEELGATEQWKTLATKLKLKRKDIKELGKEENPAEKFLDDFCCHLTVQTFLDYLQKADLEHIAENLKDRLRIIEGTQSGATNWSDKSKVQTPNPTANNRNDELNESLHLDESITDNTKIQSDDDKPWSDNIDKKTNIDSINKNPNTMHIESVNTNPSYTTNIGSVNTNPSKTTNIGSVNSTPLNVGNVGTLNVIYQLPSNNSDNPAEYEKHETAENDILHVSLQEHEKLNELVVTSQEDEKPTSAETVIKSEEKESSVIPARENQHTALTSHANAVLEELCESKQKDCTAVKTIDGEENEFRDIQNSIPDAINSKSENDN